MVIETKEEPAANSKERSQLAIGAEPLPATKGVRRDSIRTPSSIVQTEKQVRVITDAMPALISYIDLDYRYRFANRAYYEWFGSLPEDVVGKTMTEVLGDAAFKRLRPHVDRSLGGTLVTFEADTPYRTGGTKRVHATYTPDVDEDGTVRGIFVLVLDITEQKAAERAKAHLAAIVEHSDDAIISKDLNGIIQTWNRGAELLFGYHAREVVGQPVTILIPHDRLDEEPEILGRIRRGGTIAHYDTVRRHKTGKDIYISLTVSPIRNEAGQVIGASKIARDITPRIAAEKALRESQERFFKAFNASPMTVSITSLTTGRLVEVNDTFVNVTGYSRDQVIGKTTLELGLWNTESDRQAELSALVESGRLRDQEYLFRMRDGSEIVGLLSAEVIVIDGEKCALTVIQDITERRKAAEALRAANESLEAKVLERTKKLADSNAKLADEMHRRLAVERERIELLRKVVSVQEDERRRIARDMHDHFGQQLTAMRLNLDAVQKMSGVPEAVRSRLVNVQDIADSLDTDVNFLAWELRPTALDDLGPKAAIDHYTRRWSEQFQITAEFHGHSFDDGILPDDVATHLYRIVQEALNNTAKHARATRVSVVLEKRQNKAVLIVEDNGSGFEAASPPRRGLGLKGIHERVAMVGGSIEIESRLGKGTTIYVTMPLATEAKE